MARKSVIIAGQGVRVEKVAVAAFTPGMLIEQTSANKFQKHSVSGGEAVPIFALEDSLIGNDIDDDYVATNQSFGVYCSPGMLINALLADGETAVIGSKLISNGDGFLKVYAATVVDSDDAVTIRQPIVVAIAQAALDMSGSSGVDPSSQRLEVETV
jgi:hypothetical protein